MNMSVSSNIDDYPENIKNSLKNIWDEFSINYSMSSILLYYNYAKDPTAYRAKYARAMEIYNAVKSNQSL